MTFSTFVIFWLITGLISTVWHVYDEWWHYDVFENSTSEIVLQTLIMIVLCMIFGPISLAVKIWEKWFDPTNC